jgi:hypothetical protein
MIAKHTRWSFLFGVLGIVMQVEGVLAQSDTVRPHPVDAPRVYWAPSQVAIGVFFWTAGLASYAMAKGRASWWGLVGLLGLPGLYRPWLTFLSLFGLVVLVLLKDRSAASAVASESGPPDR